MRINKMKKVLCVLASFLLISGISFAEFVGSSTYPTNQGFQGGNTSYSLSSIKDVMGMYDDQITMIKGNIVNRISDDKYLFRDATGEMVVEIDYKYWAGLQVTEKDVLELTGKVDKDYDGVTLDVFMVKIAK